jgi:hypothetical protein
MQLFPFCLLQFLGIYTILILFIQTLTRNNSKIKSKT